MRPHPHPSERASAWSADVAMLIGLIGMIIIFQVFEVSEASSHHDERRRRPAEGRPSRSMSLSTNLRKRRNGIQRRVLRAARSSLTTSSVRRRISRCTLVPVSIHSGRDGKALPTSSRFSTGRAPCRHPSMLSVNMDSRNGADPLSLTNPYGFSPGRPGRAAEPASLKNCSLMELTALTGSNVFPHPSKRGLFSFWHSLP